MSSSSARTALFEAMRSDIAVLVVISTLTIGALMPRSRSEAADEAESETLHEEPSDSSSPSTRRLHVKSMRAMMERHHRFTDMIEIIHS